MTQLLYLKLDKFISNKDAIRNAFLSLKRTQDLTKITYNDLRNKSKIYDNLKSNAIKKNAKNTLRYIRKAIKEKDDNELNEIKNKETKKALK